MALSVSGDETAIDNNGDPLRSTVLVSASGCRRGSGTSGSGVVLDWGLVVTNAHVVAGQSRVVVTDVDGGDHPARVVGFDPDRDLAALQVQGFAPTPLRLTRPVIGEAGQIAGHPDGGALSTAPFTVTDLAGTSTWNIYGDEITPRPVLRGRAPVARGDSGGALLLGDGSVGGIVYAATVGDLTDAWLIPVEEVSSFLRDVAAGPTSGSGDYCLS